MKEFSTLMQTIDNRIVRDLIWSIASPALVSKSYISQYEQDDYFTQSVFDSEDLLIELDQNPSLLLNFLETKKTNRLGEKFELLWQFWMSHILGYEIIANNYQVFTQGRTLGSFDLLARPKSEVGMTHFEFTCKFYLNSGHGIRRSDWIGADGKDRLDKKTNRMLDHQLQLSKYPATQTVLDKNNWIINKHVGVFRGKLFWHLNQKPTTSPYWMNPMVEHGFWCHVSELSQLIDLDILDWYVIDKSFWFSKIAQQDIEHLQLLTLKELIELVSNHQSAVKIVGCDRKSGYEVKRGFVFPDTQIWP